jgi:hypothetical protein
MTSHPANGLVVLDLCVRKVTQPEDVRRPAAWTLATVTTAAGTAALWKFFHVYYQRSPKTSSPVRTR